MSSKRNSGLLLLCAFTSCLCAAEMTARPRVTITVDVQLPYTKRWSDAGQLEPLKTRIANTAIGYLAQFPFLEWARADTGTPHLHISLQPDPGAEGAKPWLLRITRTDHGNHPELPLELATAAEVQRIERTIEGSANQVAGWANRVLQALRNDEGARRFLATVLEEINIAGDVQPNDANVFVKVAYDDLCPDRRTQLWAKLPVTQNRPAPLQFPMTVRYAAIPLDAAMKSTHTEWQVLVPPTAANYEPYVKSYTRPASVSVIDYYPKWVALNANTIQKRKPCAAR